MFDFWIIGQRDGSRTNVYSSSRTVFPDADSQSQSHSGVYESLYSHYFVLYSCGHARELRTTGSSQQYDLIYMCLYFGSFLILQCFLVVDFRVHQLVRIYEGLDCFRIE